MSLVPMSCWFSQSLRLSISSAKPRLLFARYSSNAFEVRSIFVASVCFCSRNAAALPFAQPPAAVEVCVAFAGVLAAVVS